MRMGQHARRSSWIALIVAALGLAAGRPARADQMVEVTITNLAPRAGNYLTPVWVGFHDGQFTTFTVGSAASASLERLAEDGNTAPISADFAASSHGFAQGTIAGATGSTLPDGSAVPAGPIAPGQSTSMTFTLDPAAGPIYFSYLSMVVPSNDAFIGNGNPTALLVASGGSVVNTSFIVGGGQVLDAGTEQNTEAAGDTAFFGQSTPNTGPDENGVVHLHPGFLAGGRILSSPNFADADFKATDYQIARITIRAVPEPATLALVAVGGAIVWAGLRRRSGR